MNILQMMAVIEIFKKYVSETKHIFHAEHDTLWGPHGDYLRSITDDDVKALGRLGWRINDSGCWCCCCRC